MITVKREYYKITIYSNNIAAYPDIFCNFEQIFSIIILVFT
jgi:hypothetical protein